MIILSLIEKCRIRTKFEIDYGILKDEIIIQFLRRFYFLKIWFGKVHVSLILLRHIFSGGRILNLAHIFRTYLILNGPFRNLTSLILPILDSELLDQSESFLKPSKIKSNLSDKNISVRLSHLHQKGNHQLTSYGGHVVILMSDKMLK